MAKRTRRWTGPVSNPGIARRSDRLIDFGALETASSKNFTFDIRARERIRTTLINSRSQYQGAQIAPIDGDVRNGAAQMVKAAETLLEILETDCLLQGLRRPLNGKSSDNDKSLSVVSERVASICRTYGVEIGRLCADLRSVKGAAEELGEQYRQPPKRGRTDYFAPFGEFVRVFAAEYERCSGYRAEVHGSGTDPCGPFFEMISLCMNYFPELLDTERTALAQRIRRALT